MPDNMTNEWLNLPGKKVDCINEKGQCRYKLNGETIKDEDGEVLCSTEKIKRYIGNLVLAFCLPTDNIVLLAGAGASVVTDNKGNIDTRYGLTMKELRQVVFRKLDEKHKSNEVYDFEELAKMTSFLPKEDETNLEEFLSVLIESQAFIKRGRKKYQRSIETIRSIIKFKTSYEYNPDVFKHAALIQELSALVKRPDRLSVVTTNYDTLFEDAADYIDFTVFDGFNFTHTPKFNSDMFDWSLAKEIADKKSNKIEYKKSVINLLKIHGSLTWTRAEDGAIIRENKKNIKDPLMIFPSSNKYRQSYEDPYFELFSKFQELLKRPNTLLLTTGFSFADDHISKMIIQAIKHNPGLSILACDYTLDTSYKCSNWKELLKLQDDGFRIGFCRATLDKDLTIYFRNGGRYD